MNRNGLVSAFQFCIQRSIKIGSIHAVILFRIVQCSLKLFPSKDVRATDCILIHSNLVISSPQYTKNKGQTW